MQNSWNYAFSCQLRKLNQLHVKMVTVQASVLVCLLYFAGKKQPDPLTRFTDSCSSLMHMHRKTEDTLFLY